MKKKKLAKKSPLKKTELVTERTAITGASLRTFPIVALGGSAGSFSAFEKFFTNMPADSGIAFIIIIHLDPKHKGNLAELIQRYTPMLVTEATDGTMVKRNHVYVIPPDRDMGIHNRKLLLLPAAKPKGYRMPIDYFFQALAEDQWNRAVAIVLSGMGSDGETGIRMIKEKLGMVMVQDPATADYESMPVSALTTNQVDYILPPEEMPIKLMQYLMHPALSEEPSDQAILDSKNSNAIHKILMLLRSHTAHDFTMYKRSTITRRIDRRIAFHQLADYSKYVNFLRENPQEIKVLFNELLIGVTKFFRDQGAFESLKNQFQLILASKAKTEPIRIWVAGCSTGEEPYSIAILIAEFLETIDDRPSPKVQIFATDLDGDAIEHARQGIYLENIVADVSPERIQKYFNKKNGGYQVKKELREMIIFAQHNLIKDAPFTRLDLLSCRNVLIYLTAEIQKKIIPVFHYSLNAKGLLMLGPAETIGGFAEMFRHVDAKWKIFERKENTSAVAKMVDFPFHITRQDNKLFSAEAGKTGKKRSLEDLFFRLVLANYTPCALLLDESGDILYINGRTSRFLELSSGEARMNIHRMAREELKYVIGNLIHQSKAAKESMTIKQIKLKEKDGYSLVSLTIDPLRTPGHEGLFLLVISEQGRVGVQLKGKNKKRKDPEVDELEKELLYTKQQLNSTIEQMETSLEELKSTNEELQSTNEELQSTNEESLTTKEEMQSLNEELMTINMQYQLKAEELTLVNNDVKNMLDNTEIGTIFLDNKLEILRYTPQVVKLFNLIKTDLGRSITHVVSNFEQSNLEEEIREVIEKLKVRELVVKTRKGEWFNIRIMPYRTLDNFISGAVMTIHNITSVKRIEEKLSAAEKSAEIALQLVEEPAAFINSDQRIIAANELFYDIFRLKNNHEKHPKIAGLIEPHVKQSPEEKIKDLLTKGGKLKIEFSSKKRDALQMTVKPFVAESGAAPIALITLRPETK